MNPTRATGRIARTLAGLAAALLTPIAAAPAALAATTPRPSPADSPPRNLPGVAGAWNKHPPLPAHAHALATGGMPGWQITLIAATVMAAAIAVLLARARAARRAAASPA